MILMLSTFNEVLDNLGLDQHVHTPTHQLSVTLDLSVTRITENFSVASTYTPITLDHVPFIYS